MEMNRQEYINDPLCITMLKMCKYASDKDAMLDIIDAIMSNDAGKGRGNWGHKGRPGKRGGSSKSGVAESPTQAGSEQQAQNNTEQASNHSFGSRKEDWISIGTSIKVDGPKQSKSFIEKYLAKNPQRAERIRKQAERYKDVLSNVRNFQKMLTRNGKKPQPGTYDAVTGQLIQPEGVCVTFHQNDSIENPYGAYDPESYAMMCAIARQQLGAQSVNIGYYGNAQVSFSCKDRKTAMKFAIEHNQHSIYDPESDETIRNEIYYNEKTNPIKL